MLTGVSNPILTYLQFFKFAVNSCLNNYSHSFRSIHCDIESNGINNALHEKQRGIDTLQRNINKDDKKLNINGP